MISKIKLFHKSVSKNINSMLITPREIVVQLKGLLSEKQVSTCLFEHKTKLYYFWML